MTLEGMNQMLANLRAQQEKILEGARTASAEVAALLEAYAKTNHPWERDSGFTDASTMGTWEELPGEVFRIVLSAGMHYDVFLELARQGKWAWLWPAMEANQAAIQQIFKQRLSL